MRDRSAATRGAGIAIFTDFPATFTEWESATARMP
jgi:hypothetical protein